jgi:hypothetical protein
LDALTKRQDWHITHNTTANRGAKPSDSPGIAVRSANDHSTPAATYAWSKAHSKDATQIHKYIMLPKKKVA